MASKFKRRYYWRRVGATRELLRRKPAALRQEEHNSC